MKIAEALLKRNEYANKLNNLKERISNNVKVQEDDEPNEDYNILIKEYIEINNKLSDIIRKINIKNHEVKLEIGISIQEALNIKEKLMREIDIYKSILDEVNKKDYRLRRSEIKMKTIANVNDIQKEIDKLSKAYLEMNIMIQNANWNTEL